MDNEVKLQGYIISKYEEKTIDNKLYYFFRLKTKRTSLISINVNDEDIFNCVILSNLVQSPEKYLCVGGFIRLKGSLQSNVRKIAEFHVNIIYVVITHIYFETIKESILKFESRSKGIKPISKQDVYRARTYYSSEKPYKDNFPKEEDTRHFIKCLCGNNFNDNLEYCPYCGKSAIEILSSKK